MISHILYGQSVKGFLFGSAGKESTGNAGDLGLIPGLGRSPGEGKGYPLQYSGQENSMDCIVHGVAKSWTWLNNLHFPSHTDRENKVGNMESNNTRSLLLEESLKCLLGRENWLPRDPIGPHTSGSLQLWANFCPLLKKKKLDWGNFMTKGAPS